MYIYVRWAINLLIVNQTTEGGYLSHTKYLVSVRNPNMQSVWNKYWSTVSVNTEAGLLQADWSIVAQSRKNPTPGHCLTWINYIHISFVFVASLDLADTSDDTALQPVSLVTLTRCVGMFCIITAEPGLLVLKYKPGLKMEPGLRSSQI